MAETSIMQPTNNLIRLHESLSKDPNFTVPYAQFEKDMQDESNLQRLYSNLSKKDGFNVPYDKFKSDMFYEMPTNETPTLGANSTWQDNFDKEQANKSGAQPVSQPDTSIQFKEPGFKPQVLGQGQDNFSQYIEKSNQNAPQPEVSQQIQPEEPVKQSKLKDFLGSVWHNIQNISANQAKMELFNAKNQNNSTLDFNKFNMFGGSTGQSPIPTIPTEVADAVYTNVTDKINNWQKTISKDNENWATNAGQIVPYVALGALTIIDPSMSPATTALFYKLGQGEGFSHAEEVDQANKSKHDQNVSMGIPTEPYIPMSDGAKLAYETGYGAAMAAPWHGIIGKLVPAPVKEFVASSFMKANPELITGLESTLKSFIDKIPTGLGEKALNLGKQYLVGVGRSAAGMEAMDLGKLATDKIMGEDVGIKRVVDGVKQSITSGAIFESILFPFAKFKQNASINARREQQGTVAIGVSNNQPAEFYQAGNEYYGVRPDGTTFKAKEEDYNNSVIIPTDVFNNTIQTGVISPTIQRDVYSGRITYMLKRMSDANGDVFVAKDNEGNSQYVLGKDQNGNTKVINGNGEEGILDPSWPIQKANASQVWQGLMKDFDQISKQEKHEQEKGEVLKAIQTNLQPLINTTTGNLHVSKMRGQEADTDPNYFIKETTSGGMVSIVDQNGANPQLVSINDLTPEQIYSPDQAIAGDMQDWEASKQAEEQQQRIAEVQQQKLAKIPAKFNFNNTDYEWDPSNPNNIVTNDIGEPMYIMDELDDNGEPFGIKKSFTQEQVDKIITKHTAEQEKAQALQQKENEKLQLEQQKEAEKAQIEQNKELQKQAEEAQKVTTIPSGDNNVSNVNGSQDQIVIPLDKNGNPDVDNMDEVQLFHYNKATFGEETALKDLDGDIKLLTDKIAKANKKLETSDTKTKIKTRLEIKNLSDQKTKLEQLKPQVAPVIETGTQPIINTQNEENRTNQPNAIINGNETPGTPVENPAIPAAEKPIEAKITPEKPTDESLMNEWVANYSNDPDEMYNAFQKESQFAPYKNLTEWQKALLGVKFDPESFKRFSDKINITQTLTKAWLKKGGTTVDQFVNDYFGEGGDIGAGHEPFTVEDVVKFIVDNPNGNVRKTTDLQNLIRNRYRSLFGKSINNHKSEVETLPTHEKLTNFLNTNNLQNSWFTTEDLLALVVQNKDKLSESDFNELNNYLQDELRQSAAATDELESAINSPDLQGEADTGTVESNTEESGSPEETKWDEDLTKIPWNELTERYTSSLIDAEIKALSSEIKRRNEFKHIPVSSELPQRPERTPDLQTSGGASIESSPVDQAVKETINNPIDVPKKDDINQVKSENVSHLSSETPVNTQGSTESGVTNLQESNTKEEKSLPKDEGILDQIGNIANNNTSKNGKIKAEWQGDKGRQGLLNPTKQEVPGENAGTTPESNGILDDIAAIAKKETPAQGKVTFTSGDGFERTGNIIEDLGDKVKVKGDDGMVYWVKKENIVNEPTTDYEQQEIEFAYGNEENRQAAIGNIVKEIESSPLLGVNEPETPTPGGRNNIERSLRTGNTISKVKPRTVLEGFKESGYVDVVGQKATGPQDIADLWAIHRSPYIEKSHVIFIKNDKIVGSTALTINRLGMTFFNTADMVMDLAKKYNADGVYYLHNHPSGNHIPSDQDISLTKQHNAQLSENGIKLIGHIVIDHNKFSLIKPDGTYTEEEYKNAVPRLFLEREVINDNIDPPKRLFEISKALLTEKGYKGAIVYMSSNLDISAYDPFPEGASISSIIKIAEKGIENNIGSRIAFIHDGTYYPNAWLETPPETIDVINTSDKKANTWFSHKEKKAGSSFDIKFLWEPQTPYSKPNPSNFDNPIEFAEAVSRYANMVSEPRSRYVGGNSGYVGYSMSKRAAAAYDEGKLTY